MIDQAKNPFLAEEPPTPKQVDRTLEDVVIEKPKHLSPSTINRFIENRGAWFNEKVMRNSTFKQTPYFIRGTAIEAGIVEFLKSENIDKAVEVAENIFKSENVDHFSEKEKEELLEHYTNIRGYVTTGAKEVSLFGGLVEAQRKIELTLDCCSIPIMGYLDFVMDAPAVIDTKILSKKPSGLTQGYAIQGTVYKLATKLPVIFVAVVKTAPKGVPTFNAYQENIEKQEMPMLYWLEYLRLAATAMEAVYDCAISGDTIGLMKNMSFPNLASMWNQRDRDDLLRAWKSM